MRTSDNDFVFSPNFNFGTNNLLNVQNNEQRAPFPPVSGAMLLGDETHMLFPDGSDMLLG